MDEDIPEWVDHVTGDVKSNGHLHIWGDESTEVITSDHYVRP